VVCAAYSLDLGLSIIGKLSKRLKQLMASAISAGVLDCRNELVEEVVVRWGEYDLTCVIVSLSNCIANEFVRYLTCCTAYSSSLRGSITVGIAQS
jgi:hypothetical protein